MDAFRKALGKVAGDENNTTSGSPSSATARGSATATGSPSSATATASPSATATVSFSSSSPLSSSSPPPSTSFSSSTSLSSMIQVLQLSPPQPSLVLATPPAHSSLALATTPAPRELRISYWGISKICAICVVAGLVIGYRVRGRRVRRWVSKAFKWLADN